MPLVNPTASEAELVAGPGPAGEWIFKHLGKCDHGRTIFWNAVYGYQRHTEDGTECDGVILG